MELTPAASLFIRRFVGDRSGVVLSDEKGYLVEGRLGPLVRRLGSYQALLQELRGHPHGAIAREALEAMLTSETSFFRDGRPFEVLRRHVIPRLLVRNGAERRLTVWSAAAASGQEPYSILLLLLHHFPELRAWDLQIIASDLSESMLERGRSGRFSQSEVNRGLPAALLVTYFHREGRDWRLLPDLSSRVTFRRINLIEPWPELPALDLVFMRNVLIYFDDSTKKDVLRRVRGVLRQDGFLFLGGVETTLRVDDAYEWVVFDDGGCYRIRDGAASRPGRGDRPADGGHLEHDPGPGNPARRSALP